MSLLVDFWNWLPLVVQILLKIVSLTAYQTILRFNK